MIKVVIFDVDGTLYKSSDYEQHVARQMEELLSQMLGIPEAAAARLMRGTKSRVKTVTGSLGLLGLNRNMFFDTLADRLVVTDFISRRPEVREILVRLRNRGLKIVLHTNTGRKLALKILQALGIADECFDLLLTSDEVEPKPSLQAYREILRLFNIRPNEAVYVGDRIDVELEPAKKVGMKTILISQSEQVSQADSATSSIEKVEEVLLPLTGK